MYQVEAWSALRGLRREPLRIAEWGVSRNVVALGFTSLFTDISSEMVTTVLPIYLVMHVGLTPLQFGVLDGLYQGLTAVFRLVSGFAADRWQRYKEIAALGYGLSALCKLGLTLAGSALPLLAAVVAVDRFGKGVRTAPRDALISLSTTPANAGLAFGVHRAFDSAGAMLGPMVALVILTAMPQRFDLVFVVSFAIAALGVSVLVLFARNMRGASSDGTATARQSSWRTLDIGRLWPLLLAGALLSVTSISDAFIYLLLQQNGSLETGLFPLLYVGTAGCYLVLAVPLGRVADRVGKRATLLGGHLLLAVAYLVAAHGQGGAPAIIGCLLLIGSYYAMTDGVFMALASTTCRPGEVATGMALLSTITSAGRFVAALAFGALWSYYGTGTAVAIFSSALAAAVLLAGAIFAVQHRRSIADAATS